MKTVIKIQGKNSSEIRSITSELNNSCERIETGNPNIVTCVPKGGHLFRILVLLKGHDINYELKLY
jgi:hypothetical protein